MSNNFTPDELTHIQTLRNSVAEFQAMIKSLPDNRRSIEHNQEFNELRGEAQDLLKMRFTGKVPRAITGDLNRDRTLSAIVIFGVILTLIGLGVNSVILEDVLAYSLGCCVSSGGMLLIIGAFGVLVMRNVRERVSAVAELNQRCGLLLYQLDHRLAMSGVAPAAPRQRKDMTPPAPFNPSLAAPAPPPPPGLAPPEAD